jgi:hypothetical protein
MCAGKKGKNFLFLGCFYIILNLEVGRKQSLPFSNGLQERMEVGKLMHKPMLILGFFKSMQEEISTLT